MKTHWFYVAPLLAFALVAAACEASTESTATPNSGSPSGSTNTTGPGGIVPSGSWPVIALPTGEGASPYYTLAANGQQVGIWVSGEGRVGLVPDVALLSLGIETQATTVAEANRQAAAAMDGVMAVLRQGGIAERDIQTTYFNITPVTRWVEDRIRGGGYSETIGYRVSNQVTAKVRDLGKVGAIIDSVAAAGGDLTRIQGISFTVDNPAPALEQARELALKEALAKAQQMASVAGVTLGKPVYIAESQATPPPVYRASLEAKGTVADVGTPISPGEQEVRVIVQMVFAIQ